MASLATVSQGQQRAYNSVVYRAWEPQDKDLSTWSDYRGNGYKNGLLSEKKDYVTDEEIAHEKQHVRFSNSDEDVGTADFEAFLDDPRNSYQEGFLEKLSQLRMAHKKTLDSWQRLYEESVGVCLAKKKNKKTVSKKTTSSSSCGQYPVHKVDIEYSEQDPVEDLHCGSGVPVDTRSSFSRKNPAPRRPKSCLSNTTLKKDVEKMKKDEKDDNFNHQPRYCYQSMEEDYWSGLMTPTRSHQEEPKISNTLRTPTNKTDISDKSLSDPFSGVSRELFGKYGYNNNGTDDDGGWHHRLTIPEPFNMTKREEHGQTKKKSRTLLEYEKECEEKEKFIEEECSKMFKASPVPSHVFMPLYEEIRKKDEVRRSMVKEQTKEFLRSQERPFSFARKDDEKEQCREEEKQDEEEEERCHKVQWEEDEDKTFRANPVPRHILDSSIDEKLKDDANMREVKKKIRSYELLKNSSIPQGMEFRQKLMEQKLKSKAREVEKRHNPKIHTVPDYNALYKQFQKDLMRKRKVKENTQVQPFVFQTSELIKQRERKRNGSEDLQDGSKIGNGRLQRSNSLPDHLHSIPTKTTTSAELRTRANREKISKLKSKAASTEQIVKPKDNFLKKEIQMKISANDKKTKNTKPTPRIREQQKNYCRQLQEMRERLEKRPLLFEQVEKNNAKNRAEKKFKQTLRDCGLDENFVTEELLNSRNRRQSFPRPRSVDYIESEELSVHGENCEKMTKNYGGESNNREVSFQNESSKSSRSDDNSLCSLDSNSEDSDNGQESLRSVF